ncbi:hypothetical protein B9T62_02695 [Paenibacillus donghaensis]|uniref:Uncharacterized protein n=1 Tax=Paenibacillus donghaensis TaxID=414771 RepID=A0A2Z2KA88_9BACL|nr:hypothetical protein B9T62_02695 [Paenibacillus donghaensis]
MKAATSNPRLTFRLLRTQQPLFAVKRLFCRINGLRSPYSSENPLFRAYFADIAAMRSARLQTMAAMRK